MKKTIMSIALATIMSVSTLVGCAPKETAQNSKVETVTIWSGDASIKETWLDLTEKFNSTTGKEKGIKVEWVFSTDVHSTADVARQNDQMPELTSLTYVQARDFANTGDIVSLEDIKGLEDFVANCETVRLKDKNVINDKLYLILNYADACGLIYNKDLFKAAGIVDENGEATPPKTIAEMREYAKKITDTKNGVYGYSFPLGFHTTYTTSLPLIASFGSLEKYDFDKLEVDVSNNINAFKTMMDMRDDGSFFPGAESLDNDTSRAYFAEGKIGMMAGMLWDVGVLTSQFVAQCDWAVAPFPVIDENNVYPRWTDVISEGYYVTKEGKKKEAAVAEVVKFIYSDDVMKELYKKGLALPYNRPDVTESVECDYPQFKQFGDTIQTEYVIRQNPPMKLEGDNMEVIKLKIWSGDLTVEEAIKDLNKRYSDAFKKGVEDGSIDLDFYIEEANKTSDQG